jgi:hypothetical protein
VRAPGPPGRPPRPGKDRLETGLTGCATVGLGVLSVVLPSGARQDAPPTVVAGIRVSANFRLSDGR